MENNKLIDLNNNRLTRTELIDKLNKYEEDIKKLKDKVKQLEEEILNSNRYLNY